MGKKKAAAAPAPRPAPKPINQRGAEYQAEKLTGKRAVQGKLPTGGPRYVYEVKWSGINPATKKPWPCSFEPAGCLIGWEAQMKAVDAAIESKKNEPQLNPVKEALARLFSIVGIAFSDKRKRSSASTLASIAFTKVNL